MTRNVALAPGLYYEVVRPAAEPQPLRSDIAAFIGRFHRGPVGVPVRVEGWREAVAVFGDLDTAADSPYSLRGYFENGGELAWVIRLAGEQLVSSRATWSTTVLDRSWNTALDRYDIAAASPGAWSDRAQVELVWHWDATRAEPVFDITTRTSADGTERLAGVAAANLVEEVAQRSDLIRIVPGPGAMAPVVSTAGQPRVRRAELVMTASALPVPDLRTQYLTAVDQLIDLPEVALVAMPDLYNDVAADAADVLRTAIGDADELRDRLVLVDLPPHDAIQPVADVLAWLDGLGRIDGTHIWRAAAAYHPRIDVLDPLGGVTRPLRRIAPSGHVAGMISQSDRLRGAHQTPANVPLIDVLDISEERTPGEHGLLNAGGVNLIKCLPRRGYAVMGGRTLDGLEGYRFVAHRRLLHRLVRAIRLAAQPLVFEANGPDLWVAFVRAASGVLLEAWRAGALKGNRPEEAYRVQCDAETNPPEQVDNGRCLCLIAFAPATPMEFVLLRVALSRDGSLEVLT